MTTKSQNKLWIIEDGDTPLTVKRSRSVKKKLTAVFFKRMKFCKKGSQLNGTLYTTCLVIEYLKDLLPKSVL